MERQRVIFLVLVIAWTIFRLVRYLRTSGAKRPPPVVPPSVVAATPMTARSPIEPGGTGGAGLARNLVTAAVFSVGAVVIWSLLFLVPAFDSVPELVRMIVGVLATLYLIQVARGAATRFIGAGQRSDARDNDPIK